MVQVDEAISIIKQNSFEMPARKIKVGKSLGFVMAEAVYSPMDLPSFRQSAMDGYAFSYGKSKNFKVIGSSRAGDFSNIKIEKDQAIRIFTGAFVPDAADTVVMQEHVKTNGNSVEIIRMPAIFANVRNKGEQIKEKDRVLGKHTLITPAAIGFLANLGITEITVYSKPKVVIVVTGNELVRAGEKLPLGKIYESNSMMLEAALKKIGIKHIKTIRVKDHLKETRKVLKKCLSRFDAVLISGGISVGDYDFVKEALLSNGVEELFYKINQKPAKPLFFGKKKATLVFALPGNPASALISFYVYVLPALKKMMGFQSVHLPEIKRKINTQIENSSGKSLFLKALYDDGTVRVLDGQSSAMLNTFAVANGLIHIPYDVININKNQEVTVLAFN